MQTTPNEPPPEKVATGADVLDQLLTLSGRGYTVVRHILLQLPDDVDDRLGVLGPMVTDRKRRSLQIYLLLLTIWPWLQNQESPLANKVWARALTTETGRKWSATNVSEAWGDLEERGLVTRHHLSRGVVVIPRREDGAVDYTQPGTKKGDHRESYFVLPGDFWRTGTFEKLSLPGLAMLLIIAGRTSENPETWLTNKDAGAWYGLSPRSVEGGIEDLRKAGLLEERIDWIKAPLSPIGATKRHYYRLTGKFSTEQRRELQANTQAEVQTRTAAKARRKVSAGDTQTQEKTAESATASLEANRRREEKNRT